MVRLSRREVLATAAIAAGASACRHVSPNPSSGADTVTERVYANAILDARARAGQGYVPRADDLPAALRELGYLAYRDIVFRDDASLELGNDFTLQLFHRGHFHKGRIDLFIQPREGQPTQVGYDPARFTLGSDLAGQSFAPDLGHAGFRLHHQGREFLVFLDAAYFRLRGLDQEYGLSGRGVAIDTGRGDKPEEFPDFTTFWVIEPDDDAPFVDIVALLDGPSVTGAFVFRAQPGYSATLLTRACLFMRQPVETLGLAPLTSMFVHGSNGPVGHYDDFRPEVHDSDGLFLRTAAEPAAWRPLVNGRPTPRTSSFDTPGLSGFGLLQRQRRFDAYIDTRARYEDRPGVMVDVGRDFPAGNVRLYEIPSPEEYMDNIVAYVVPEKQPAPGERLEYSYRMATVGGERVSSMPRVVWTRIGSADRMRFVEPPIPGRRIYFVDWEGRSLPQDPDAKVTAEVTASTGTIVEPVVEYVAKTRGWRVYFEHRPGADAVAELRATLHLDGAQIVETWLYGV